MTDHRELLERALATDPADIGCDEALAVLHIYVDLVAADRDAAGRGGAEPSAGESVTTLALLTRWKCAIRHDGEGRLSR